LPALAYASPAAATAFADFATVTATTPSPAANRRRPVRQMPSLAPVIIPASVLAPAANNHQEQLQALMARPAESTQMQRQRQRQARPPVELTNVLREAALGRAEAGVAAEALTAAINTLIEQNEATQRGVQEGTNVTVRVLRRTNEILSLSKNIHSITTQTLSGVKTLVRRAAAGDGSIFRDIIMNEWLALLSIFLAYPQFPVTIEFIAPIWGVLLMGNFGRKIVTSIARRELNFFDGGPIRWTFTLVTSAPHAIFLLFQLSGRLNAAKHGSSAYGPFNTGAYQNAYGTTNLESTFIATFQSVLANCRTAFELSNEANKAAVPLDARPVSYWQGLLERMSREQIRIVGEIQAMDPEGTMFANWPGFINLLARYLAGTLYYTSAAGINYVVRAPAYLYQADLLRQSELFLIMSIFQFLNGALGGSLTLIKDYVKTLMCPTLCGLQLYLSPASSGWDPTSIIKEAMKTVPYYSVSAVASAMGCPCPTTTKLKTDGGGKTSKRRLLKKSTRKMKGGQVPAKMQSEVTVLMWECLMLFALSSTQEMRNHFKINPAELAQIEENGNMIIGDLLTSGQFAPAIWFEGIEQYSGLGDEPFLLTN
jgi:hypothetical protein